MKKNNIRVIIELEALTPNQPIECVMAFFDDYNRAKDSFNRECRRYHAFTSLRDIDAKKVTISVVYGGFVQHRYTRRVVGFRNIEENF